MGRFVLLEFDNETQAEKWAEEVRGRKTVPFYGIPQQAFPAYNITPYGVTVVGTYLGEGDKGAEEYGTDES